MLRTLRNTLGLLLSLAAILASVLIIPKAWAMAPGDVIGCGAPQNLSKSPGFTSADPFMIADQTGRVHLFWAERIFGEANAVPDIPDALVYSYWDGASWSVPKDLFLSPPQRFNKRVSGIRGVITDDGYIHLVWIGPDNIFYYSAVRAAQAQDAVQWRPPQELAIDQSASQYSVAIAHTPPQTLHVLYGQGISENRNRSLAYIRSDDNGLTWTAPENIFTFPQLGHGPGNVRLLTDGPNKVYATWTEWDQTGNGQVIYFARSLDSGRTWQTPVVLDRRLGNEYERDWVTLAVLGEDELVAFWEGGWRAYRQAQYSDDGGATWSEPIDTLDWLIADNGFAEFVRDNAGRLHLFVFQRVREGNDDKGDREGLWHTVWEGGREWREPEMVGDQNPSNFVTVDINNGNELFAAWFDYTYFEVHAIRCSIEGADPVQPQPWPTLSVEGQGEQELGGPSGAGEISDTEDATPLPTPIMSRTPLPPVQDTGAIQGTQSLAVTLAVGLAPVILLIGIVLATWYLRRAF